jgi:8-oxo-dGTP diphosphatase
VYKEPVEVAAAVIERGDGSFLLAQRPGGKVYAGFWEFPGGKIEPGETPLAALKRELSEELGVGIVAAYPWVTRIYSYPHATVRLNFLRVTVWTGEPVGREGQSICWQQPGRPSVGPMLPANAPVLRALELPLIYAITHASGYGIDAALLRLDAALARGVRLVQLRESELSQGQLEYFAAEAIARVHRVGGRVLINGDEVLANRLGADGVHLASAKLATARERPRCEWCAASCHDRAELDMALRLGVDFVVLGPVKPTPSHPSARTLGWDGLAKLSRGYPLPIYALGGLRRSDLAQARAHGAHGLAMIRGAWEEQSNPE